jgi:hypothetical protein
MNKVVAMVATAKHVERLSQRWSQLLREAGAITSRQKIPMKSRAKEDSCRTQSCLDRGCRGPKAHVGYSSGVLRVRVPTNAAVL